MLGLNMHLIYVLSCAGGWQDTHRVCDSVRLSMDNNLVQSKQHI